jgi:hypothetical protein
LFREPGFLLPISQQLGASYVNFGARSRLFIDHSRLFVFDGIEWPCELSIMSDEIKKARSPSCPQIPLPEAIEYTKKLHVGAGSVDLSRETAIGPMGFKTMNGIALMVLASLKQYGLIDSKHGGSLHVSDLALKLIHPTSEQQEEKARQEAALSPKVFRELTRGGYGRCDENVLANHLVQMKFTPSAAKTVAAAYKENWDFAKLDSVGIIEPENEDEDPPDPPAKTPNKSPVPPNNPPPPPVQVLKKQQHFPQGGELPIPLDGGRVAMIPFPMSKETYDLFVGTLKLWEKRLVSEPENGSPET